eukprot:10606178-Alexandrium_andersonii.AAC.1
MGIRGNAGVVSSIHVQPVPRGITMPAETTGAQVRASRPPGASQHGNQPPQEPEAKAPPPKAPAQGPMVPP